MAPSPESPATPEAGPKAIGPPKPVTFPKASTLIEVPGWQILADANQDQMRNWLDEKKKDKHSVVWLDAIQVDDNPLYCAAAALDGRAADWRALLDVKCAKGENVGQSIGKLINAREHSLLSISGFHKDGESYAVGLFRPESKQWSIAVDEDPLHIDEDLARILKNGFGLRILRPYLIEQGVVQFAVYVERNPEEKTAFAHGKSEAQLNDFLGTQRTDGLRPLSVAAVPQAGGPRFSASAAENPTKAAWSVDLGLTVPSLESRAKDQGARGFSPASVTAYPWDGAVRYCVVWVKEPPGGP